LQQSRGADPLGSAPQPVLTIEGLSKAFGKREVLRGIDLEIRPGELTVVLGANGSGKSTLLRCATRLIEPDAGTVMLCGTSLLGKRGEELREARRTAAMIFQQVLLVRRRTALENVQYGALGELPLYRSLSTRFFPGELRERAFAALERVRLGELAQQRAGTLSGGQAQRVAVARALCQQARVILADEPVASLDPRAAESVLSLLAEVAHDEQLGVLVVLHQPELARRYADRLVGFLAGGISFDRVPDAVSDDEIALLYADEHDEA
jgi:phosphonate transport system ATP-binding protein